MDKNMRGEYDKLAGEYQISAREYFMVLELAIYHVNGVWTRTSTEVVKAEKTPETWERACIILNALYEKREEK